MTFAYFTCHLNMHFCFAKSERKDRILRHSSVTRPTLPFHCILMLDRFQWFYQGSVPFIWKSWQVLKVMKEQNYEAWSCVSYPTLSNEVKKARQKRPPPHRHRETAHFVQIFLFIWKTWVNRSFVPFYPDSPPWPLIKVGELTLAGSYPYRS